MHTAANYIVSVYRGKFPQTYSELVNIKGIGDYTAAAIASFSFGEAVPVVDGNVNRVIARLYGIQYPIDKTEGKKQIRKCAEDTMVRSSPAIYNQAIMEFGALQCVPHNPDCEICILKSFCVGYAKELVSELPVKSKIMNIKTRYFHYLVVNYKNDTYLQKRSGGDIWKGLYEFPMIETDTQIEPEALEYSESWQSWFSGQVPAVQMPAAEVIHRLTHRILKIRFYEIHIDQPMCIQGQIQVPWSDIHQYAVPKVMDNYLKSRLRK
jgi:A/G-specific adenine glycosylase